MTEQIKSRLHAACNQILSLTINPDFNFLACELGDQTNQILGLKHANQIWLRHTIQILNISCDQATKSDFNQ